ncbi:MAG: hypothetical protein ABIQ35_13715, partial [Verrucomicrobiota bacterium]
MKFPAPLFFGCVIFSMAFGCQKFHPQPLSSVAAGASFEARALDNPGLREFLEENLQTNFVRWPLRSWDFPTLTLAAF